MVQIRLMIKFLRNDTVEKTQLTKEEESHIRAIISIYTAMTDFLDRLLDRFEIILYYLFVAIIALISFIILKYSYPAFEGISIKLAEYGIISWIPILVFGITCILVAERILRLLKVAKKTKKS